MKKIIIVIITIFSFLINLPYQLVAQDTLNTQTDSLTKADSLNLQDTSVKVPLPPEPVTSTSYGYIPILAVAVVIIFVFFILFLIGKKRK